MPSMCVGMEGAPHEGVAERFSETNTMKKILAALVAFAALTATFPAGYVYTNDQRGLGSITARIGYTWGPGLVYVKGGYAYSDNAERVTLGGVPTAFLLDGNHSNGYTVGTGVEYMFAPNWSVKGEYMYYDS